MAEPSRESVRQMVEQILAQPEFQPASDLQADWLEWLKLHPLPGFAGWLILAGCVGGLGWLLWQLFSLPSRRLTPAGQEVRPSWSEISGQASLVPREALEQALVAVRQGDLRQALWVGHRSLLYRLSELGLIRFSPGRTNSDYLGPQGCPSNNPHYRLLKEITEHYEQVVYGHRSVPPQAVEDLLRQVIILHP